MNIDDKKQVLALLKTMEEQRACVPYLTDFLRHPSYGPLFSSFSTAEQKEVEELIHDYIVDSIAWLKTKGWIYFKRFLESDPQDFWRFRELNASEENVDTEEFQTLGHKIEQEMFRYEWLLTEMMLNRPESLDKVVSSFYNIVYRFFPYFWKIKTE